MTNRPLQGKTTLVTGASSGIGAACARALASDGAAVVIMGRRKEALVKTRAALLSDAPDARIEIFAGDACAEADVKAALRQALDIAERLDILVPAVGGCEFKPLLLQDAATFLHEFELNVLSAFLMVRYGVPLMNEGGSIVCISSSTVVQPFEGVGTYVAAKAGLERLVRAAAVELGGARADQRPYARGSRVPRPPPKCSRCRN